MVVIFYCRGAKFANKQNKKKVLHEPFSSTTGENDDNDGDVGNGAGILQMIFSRACEFTQDCYKSQTIIFY